ncbi:16S rRNA (guanine(966)-N(2))-methyltransferase RsmD [Secundilactobacillus malefermentans]|uniref:16S rRNA (guanine(966)-N(2))-methyltransferase RsmD n=1 Tax=Secundilactobacillus malefermentans TaxID=176292 RepID=UPI0011CC2367|nr:16S rRNA (guanine(966)-N(2))-methyltransferase RsmD [Secundilactobacillus malefermentans]QEA30828.1 16S rRNA (guanine(966)-N(2))-methyltransferase RsmD [Secundilactobacillus malefermentans]
MRVVAGQFGGRRLKAVPGTKTRPTTDKIKESLFNIIGPYFEGGNSLDLFAGSGGLSIEAVSRGIDMAYLVDRQGLAIKTIKQNIEVTKSPNQFSILKRDANLALKQFSKQNIKFSLVFFDPPYKEQKISDQMASLKKLDLLSDDAIIACETDQDAKLGQQDGFRLVEKKDYGITEINIYRFGEEEHG